jgi:hypothetical protein
MNAIFQNRKVILLLLATVFFALGLVKFLKGFLPDFHFSKVFVVLYFFIAILYSYYFNIKSVITNKDKFKFYFVVCWAVINGASYLRLFQLYWLVILFLIISFVLIVMLINQWVNADLSFKNVNFLTGISASFFMLDLLIKILHWPGLGVVYLFVTASCFLLAIHFVKEYFIVESAMNKLRE